MSKNTTATIKNPERAKDLKEIFGSDKIYITSPLPTWISINGKYEKAFFIDLEQYDAKVIEKLVQHLSVKFHLSVDEIKCDLPKIGVPILDKDCIMVTTSPMMFIDDDRGDEDDY